ncbi:type II CAAX prenyl endopeptidase Rce1 family protein [Mucilaginibacter sp.]|uniref:CPBP family glutamic-type intramembrane protease n=1 Tax=Mucilaginibacter sp. TaxID=1882438 RepID=UPI0038CD8C61
MFEELLKISEYPDLALKPQLPFKEKTVLILKTYGLIWLFIIFTVPLILLADHIATHVFHYNSISDQNSVTFQHLIKKIGYLTAIIYICLIGPLLEETIFRLPLSFKKTHIALSLAVAVLLFSSAIPYVKTLNHSIGFASVLLIRIVLAGLIYALIVNLIPRQILLSRSTKKKLIITSICLFGLMHVSNYSPLHWAIIWIYPIYVLPQLLMGWALSYIRFKNGFIWGVVLHCLINSVTMGLGFSQNKPDKRQHTEKPILKKVDSPTKTPISPLSPPHS